MLAIASLLVPLVAGEPSPSFEVTSVAHLVRTTASGFGPGVEGSTSDEESSTRAAREWTATLESELVDDAMAMVARGTGYQESLIGQHSLSFVLEATAETAGANVDEAATGWSRYDVSFSVPSRVRYVLRAGAGASAGANAVWVRLDGANAVAVDLVPSPGDSGSAYSVGWLPAGEYTLSGRADVFAHGSPGVAEAQHASVDADLDLYHPADFDLDGVVDRLDRLAFFTAYRVGDVAADVDGNGRVEAADARAFEVAWSSVGD